MQHTSEKQPLISVIVPVYNTAELLPRCIDSILNQTHKNIELILVNDGSTDESGGVCDEYAKKDERVRVIHQQNAGESGARNTGLAAARGEWIAQVDSDDYIDLEMYEKLLRAAIEQNTLLSACGYIRKRKNVDDEVLVFPQGHPKTPATECIEWKGGSASLVQHVTMLYHREIINAPILVGDAAHSVPPKKHTMAITSPTSLPLRYDTAVHIGQDRLFFVEVLLRVGELAYIPEVLYTWDCTREDNATNSPFSEKNITRFIALKKIIELLEPISPNAALHERRKLARFAFSFMMKALLSEHAHLNALYPECRKAAKGNMRYMLADKETKMKSKIKGCIVYLFPRFARAAWKLRSNLKGE